LATTLQVTRAWALLALAGAAALIFALDRVTGLAPVQHLYYFPIIFGAIRFGMPGGTGFAAAAIVLYHLANPHMLTWRYEESDVFQVAVFIAVGFVAAKLGADARRLHRLAMTDDLTGLDNLRSFELRLRAMVEKAQQEHTPLSILVLDVDRLKSLNDEHGHLAGAEAVRTVGHVIAAHLPPDALACRYGGDEFAIALPRCATQGAVDVADNLCRAVGAQVPVLAGLRFPEGTLSVSVGVASRSFDASTPAEASAHTDDIGEALFRAADAALYAAKHGGRNRVHVA
jgi:diguanylate cyclase (GGDEF)-like protein